MFKDVYDLQACRDEWRTLQADTPAWRLGVGSTDAVLPTQSTALTGVVVFIEYSAVDAVRTVHGNGQISFQGKIYRISEALRGKKSA